MSKEALVVHSRSNDKGNKNDKSRKGRSKSHGKSKTPRKPKAKCWNYDKTGHFHKDYKEPKKKKKALDSSSKKSQEDGDAFIATLAVHEFDDVWLIDSSASFHMKFLMVERCT